jgi:hypothetical protein
VIEVPQHDGSIIKLRKLASDYDPSDKVNAITHIARAAEEGEVLTGLLYLSPDAETSTLASTPTPRLSTSSARRTSARARRCWTRSTPDCGSAHFQHVSIADPRRVALYS